MKLPTDLRAETALADKITTFWSERGHWVETKCVFNYLINWNTLKDMTPIF